MNAVTFASAYRQLRPSEKAFVDGYVQTLQIEYDRRGERLSNALYRVATGDEVAKSRGMLDKPMVLAAINERIVSISGDSELSPQMVIRGLLAMFKVSQGDFMTVCEDGRLEWDFTKATPEQLWAIKSIEYDAPGPRSTGKVKVTLHDKLAVMDKLMQFMGMMENDNPIWREYNARPVVENSAAGGPNQSAAETYSRLRDLR